MDIAVFGSGVVGRTLGARLVELGHAVVLGTRDPAGPRAREWLAAVGTARGARVGTYAGAAAHGELVVNATSGAGSIAAMKLAGERALAGKVLLDVANPIEAAPGLPVSLSVVNGDSLAEQLQRSFPGVRVVKSLNTVTCELMVHPRRLGEDHTMFVAGDNAEAKATVADLLRAFGWRSILDVGGIEAARGMEMYLPLWSSLMAAQGTAVFNIRLVRG